MREQINRLISWVLVIDFALVLASLGWFVVAVVGRSFNFNLGLERWYQLWNPLFLPAISLLMAGAIASGVVGWVSRKLDQFKAEP